MKYYTLLENKIRKQKIREYILNIAGWSIVLGLIYTCLIIATNHM